MLPPTCRGPRDGIYHVRAVTFLADLLELLPPPGGNVDASVLTAQARHVCTTSSVRMSQRSVWPIWLSRPQRCPARRRDRIERLPVRRGSARRLQAAHLGLATGERLEAGAPVRANLNNPLGGIETAGGVARQGSRQRQQVEPDEVLGSCGLSSSPRPRAPTAGLASPGKIEAIPETRWPSAKLAFASMARSAARLACSRLPPLMLTMANP